METTSSDLKWSAQLNVHDSVRRSRLHGDKITLPQSALEGLLASAPVVNVANNPNRNLTSNFDPFNPYSFEAERYAREALSDRQQQLPHPLTFRLVNPRNGRAVYAGIREFSAEENEVELSTFLQEALGLRQHSEQSSRDGTPSSDVDMIDVASTKEQTVTIHAKQLPKGTYVRLRPLEAGYDPEDWKSLLERYLRDNFTTLTMSEILDVPGPRHEHFRFLVDKFEPDGEGICVVDTDLEVDIEPLNEEQARETLQRRLAKSKRTVGTVNESSAGGILNVNQELQGQVFPGDYVDYELKEWNHGRDLEVVMETGDEVVIDLFVSPFSARQRPEPRGDEHIFGDQSSGPTKRLKIAHTNVDIEDAESLFVSVYAPTSGARNSRDEPRLPLSYTITASNELASSAKAEGTELPPDEVICKNCHQHIPKRTLPLHEAFCYRNNILCPKCDQVFLKNSQTWKSHWHCPHDTDHGNTALSLQHHNEVFHPSQPIDCPNCDFLAFNLPILAHHRTTTCPGKEILCQFCHLIVPQRGPEDPDFTEPEVLLSGLTPHELTDGARTTECHICNKIVRLRDMKVHLKFHDRDRLSQPRPRLCINRICGRTIRHVDETRILKDQLGLCNECFGPLYTTSYDPEGKALRRRIERRLLTQLMAGCGKEFCHNDAWCRTGRKNTTGEDKVVTAKDALPVVRPVMDALARGDSSGVVFCTDQASQTRRAMGEMVAAEGVYELEWAVKALEEEKGDLSRAREWLKDRAPRVGEVVH